MANASNPEYEDEYEEYNIVESTDDFESAQESQQGNDQNDYDYNNAAHQTSKGAGASYQESADGSQGADFHRNMKEILKRTGYNHEVSSGQHKYGGPPPNFTGTPPGPGHEIYVGKIPTDILEDELIPMFEKCGKIYELRLMINPLTQQNKGFCFVTFIQKSGAEEAARMYNDYEIRPRKFLKVNVSIPNVRLYLGNIPKNRTRDQIFDEVSTVVEGLRDVIVYDMPDNPKIKNRGFAFLDFETHKYASEAKKKISAGTFRIFNLDCIVNWADAQEEPGDEVMSKVKVLYVRNLKADVTQQDMEELFGPYGQLEKVKRIRDFAFIHFVERQGAVKALQELHNKKIKDSVMNITLARPPIDPKVKEQRKAQHMALRGTHSGTYSAPAFGVPMAETSWKQPRAATGFGMGQSMYYEEPYYEDYEEYGYEDYGYEEDYYYDDYSDYSFGYDWQPTQPTPVSQRGIRAPARGRIQGSARSRAAHTVRPSRPPTSAPRPLMGNRPPRGGSRGISSGGFGSTQRGLVRGATARGGALKRKPSDGLFGVDSPHKQMKFGQSGPSHSSGSMSQAQGQSQQAAKRPTDAWQTQPIAQKPLNQMMMGFGEQWF